MPLPRTVALLSGLLVASPLIAHPNHADTVATDMAVAAAEFTGTLDDAQRAEALFPADSEERTNWHFVPMERKGLVFKSMNERQRQAALALLHTALSTSGGETAEAIMQHENILRGMENGAPHRDPELYYVAIFGKPGTNPWGWRFEGHHMSVNQTITDAGVSGTPLFFGANPAKVPEGQPRAGFRLLGDLEDMGRSFVLSLDNTQRATAIIAARAANEIETAQKSRISPLDPKGLKYTAMTPAQQTDLRAILDYFLARHRDEISANALAKIAANGMDNLVFAWAGPTEVAQGHYFRIQGPTFVIEYGNTQNNANHHHTVFRDFEDDFGRDLLGDHYREQH